MHAWAFEADCDPDALHNDSFAMEWPPRSGWQHGLPEVDRAAFYGFAKPRDSVSAGQLGMLESPEWVVDAW